MQQATPLDSLVDVASISDLPAGTQRTVLVGSVRILLCHDPVSQCISAVEDQCPHAFQPLAGGVVRDGVIQCPKHGACFNLATGQPTNAVTKRPIKVHAVRIQDGRIQVSLSPLKINI